MPCINTKKTGKQIGKLIAEKGYTVKDIQKVFGFAAPQAIYKWLHGESIPTIDNLVILADFLNVTIDMLLVVETV